MKSELDIEILMERMQQLLDKQAKHPKLMPKDPRVVAHFKIGLLMLAWVLERMPRSDIAVRADAIVELFKESKKRRLSSKRLVKRVPLDHFAM